MDMEIERDGKMQQPREGINNHNLVTATQTQTAAAFLLSCRRRRRFLLQELDQTTLHHHQQVRIRDRRKKKSVVHVRSGGTDLSETNVPCVVLFLRIR